MDYLRAYLTWLLVALVAVLAITALFLAVFGVGCSEGGAS
jgi:hypothetical protein